MGGEVWVLSFLVRSSEFRVPEHYELRICELLITHFTVSGNKLNGLLSWELNMKRALDIIFFVYLCGLNG